jgi:succinate dehydrogenase/fumarate reductase flavoprotein subunit
LGGGEPAGGATGANRLSGNALPEAVVFGERAGEKAAQFAAGRAATWDGKAAAPHLDLIRGRLGCNAGRGQAPAQLMGELKTLMWGKVGAFRNARDLTAALARLKGMREHELDALAVSVQAAHNTGLVEWFELRNGLLAAEAVASAALARRESRGAHQRDDFPKLDDRYLANQRLSLEGGDLVSSFAGLSA